MQQLFSQHGLSCPAPIDFISRGDHGLRHRMDFSIRFDEISQSHKVGFYDQQKQILDIENCLQASVELQSVFTEFRAFRFYIGSEPIQKMSVRLRTGLNAQKGAWLDLANVEIKRLLHDGAFLMSLLEAGFTVEIGQKGKCLVETVSGLKLGPPRADNWFSTCDGQGATIPLSGLISDFTQPSRETAHAMVEVVLGWLQSCFRQDTQNAKILEFGPGLGQFTLAFLKSGFHVSALEIHSGAAEQLKKNAVDAGCADYLQVFTGDYHRRTSPTGIDDRPDIAFVNPARSGLKGFTQELLRIAPEYIAYVSCFPESMALDLQVLSEAYQISDVKIVDQFPQTAHFEGLVLLKKTRSENKF